MTKNYEDMSLEELLKLEENRRSLTPAEVDEQIIEFTYSEWTNVEGQATTKEHVTETVRAWREVE